MADNGSRANIPELDGIRGLAILAVIVFHAGTLRSWNVHPLVLDIAGFGWAGVDLFFVLSGFLITGILLDVRGTGGALRNFYARRVLRIFPLYYTALLLYFHLLPAAARAFSLLQGFVRTEEAWYWLYLSNLSPSAGTAHPQLTHFWSLSIEEQFYLVWPLLVLRLNNRKLLRICGAAILLVPCIRLAVTTLVPHPEITIYRNTLCRLDTLGFGALTALVVRESVWLERAYRARASLLALAALGVAACLAVAGTSSYEAPMNLIGFTCLALLFSYALLWAREGGPGLRALLRSGPLRSIGKYSYAMYVVHVPIVLLLLRLLNRPSSLAREWTGGAAGMAIATVAATALSYGAGYLSWVLLERRFLQLKSRFEHRAPAQIDEANSAPRTAKPTAPDPG